MAYVIGVDGKPLMPCKPVIARRLLKQGKAKVKHRVPFTIRLLYETTSYTQPLIHGLDTGSSMVGSAVVDERGHVVYVSEIEIRNDLSGKMKRRSRYRKNRRSRKTRYRGPRWSNRKNSIKSDRFSPTMQSKIHSHLKEFRFVNSLLPITKTILETGTFDPHALKNPEVLKNKALYQKGINYGYANSKAYVLVRDGYRCRRCKGKSKVERLEVHHIVFKSENGSDEPENLITLCHACHTAVHQDGVSLKLRGKKRGALKHATQMNSIRVQLLKLLPQAEETFGFITKAHRQLYNMDKGHATDAVFIAGQGKEPKYKTNILLQKKCISNGDYQQHKGIRSEKKIETGKISGFRKYDRVSYQGHEYFIKGRMATGYAILMDINGQKIDFKPMPKFENMKRQGARKSWIMFQKTIANT